MTNRGLLASSLLALMHVVHNDAMQPTTHMVTVPASPSVLATVFTVDGQLGFVVLWRGRPDWWSKSSGHDGTKSSTFGARGFAATLNYGSVTLDVEYDGDTHKAIVQGKETNLPAGTNILLVDNADGGSPSVSRTLTVDQTNVTVDPPRSSLAPLLGRSSDIVAFLRCDQGTMTAAISYMACGELGKR
jgi:hypothetical protein